MVAGLSTSLLAGPADVHHILVFARVAAGENVLSVIPSPSAEL